MNKTLNFAALVVDYLSNIQLETMLVNFLIGDLRSILQGIVVGLILMLMIRTNT